jgi:uncharacterized protein (TIGR02391 family)
MLDDIITEGRTLLQKVRQHYLQDPNTLRPDQQVTVTEVEGWYRGVDRVLQQFFGENSSELQTWREALRDSRDRSWEAVSRGDAPRGESWVVHLLAESLGTLAEIKLAAVGSRTTTAPAMAFEALHPRIAEKCRSLYAAGEYDSAVFNAFRAVEEELRRKSAASATEIGVTLVSTVFGQREPKLCASDVPAEQEAVHALFRGAIGAFKNPLSHRSIGHSDPTRVFELLALASLLFRIIDEAVVKDA